MKTNYCNRLINICLDIADHRDVFGDAEPYTINDEDKQRIKEFVQKIMKEWEEKCL